MPFVDGSNAPSDLPEELRWLFNIIEDAKVNHAVSNLRGIVKRAADEAPPEDVIRMAEFVYRRGVEIHRSRIN